MGVIRTALANDESAVVALWTECGLVVPWNDPSRDFHFAVDQPNSDILVCEAKDRRVVASVMVGHDGHRGWIYYLCAALDTRGQGLVRGMMTGAEDWLRSRGIPKLQLMVKERDAEVVSFYTSLGFELSPRIVLQKWLSVPPPGEST